MNTEARINKAVASLVGQGYALVPNLVSADAMSDLAEQLEPHFDAVPMDERLNATSRIHSRVIADAPVLQEQLVDPVITGILDQVLGPNCVKYQLSSIQGIKIFPGAEKQGLHRDDDIFRLPHPHPTFEVNVMWAVTDFLQDNGATRVIPHSHEWPSGQEPASQSEIVASMPAGSALIWLGSTWHGAGANTTSKPRIGVYAGYSLGWLRQEETLYLALPPDTVRPMSKELQRLIGYEKKGSLTLGWLDGRDPRELLDLDT